jgi:hypothetical protein
VLLLEAGRTWLLPTCFYPVPCSVQVHLRHKKKKRLLLFSKEIQVKGEKGGNDIFYFPHNPDVGKKKDFLWIAATTLIFYADKIFPYLKKKTRKIMRLQLGS